MEGGPGVMSSVVRILGLALVGLVVILVGMLGPYWFMAIPWWVRWRMGMVCFWGLVAALLRWTLRRSPPRPWPRLDPAAVPDPAMHRAMAWALQAATLSFAIPFFARPGLGGVCDWDLHLVWFEALRQSVVRWHQFPWWDPWLCGGFPLAAEPQVGLISLDTPLVLLFGTSAGIRLAAVGSMMLATEGARRLARLWLADPWAVALVAVVYSWNGAILLFTVSGHALTICYPFLPWMLVYAFQINRGARAAVLLGVASAASVLTVIQYPTAYAMLITAAVLGWGSLAEPVAARSRYASRVALAAGVFLALTGWRLVMTGRILLDFPRTIYSMVDVSIYGLLHATVDREIPPSRVIPYTEGFNSETACYVGAATMLAAFVSLRRGWRWWHTLTAVCFAMAMGSVEFHHPSYWIREWPGFSTMHMVGRWRIPGVLGIALAAGDEIQSWRTGGGRLRTLAAALVIGVICDLALYVHQCLPTAFSVPPAELQSPGPPVERIVNVQTWEFEGATQGFEAVRRGYGVIQGYCPQLGYERGRPTARLWRDHPGYRGEFVAGGKAVEPRFWSPNRIVLEVRPGEEIEVNQNPGSYWWGNGRQLFPGARCVELTGRFVARADERGRLVLEIWPPGVRQAAGLTLAGLVLAGACLWIEATPRARRASWPSGRVRGTDPSGAIPPPTATSRDVAGERGGGV